MSSSSCLSAAQDVGQGSFFPNATGESIYDDHYPFLREGVPSIDLIDFDYGPGPSPGAWWHTRRDDLAHVCAGSLAAVGEPAVAGLLRTLR